MWRDEQRDVFDVMMEKESFSAIVFERVDERAGY